MPLKYHLLCLCRHTLFLFKQCSDRVEAIFTHRKKGQNRTYKPNMRKCVLLLANTSYSENKRHRYSREEYCQLFHRFSVLNVLSASRLCSVFVIFVFRIISFCPPFSKPTTSAVPAHVFIIVVERVKNEAFQTVF